MAKPSSTIAAAVCESQATLRAFTLAVANSSKKAASPIAPHDGSKRTIQTRPEDGIDDPVLDALHGLHGEPQSLPVVPELSPIARPTAAAPGIADVASMPAGVGGFNIDLAGPRVTPADGEVIIEDTRSRSLLKPEPIPHLPIRTKRKTAIVWIGRWSFVFNSLAIIAIVGLMLLAFLDDARKQVSDVPRPMTPLPEGSSPETSPDLARLVVESQKAFANEPVPLGISLKDPSGGETVTVAGLANGTELSLGTSLGLAGWLVSAHDLDKTFVGAPKNFVGVMDATANLRSDSGRLLHSQVVRLEWIEKKQEDLMPALGPEPAAVIPPLDPEQIAALVKVGRDLLKQGDIATARPMLKRAAIAGNAQAALELGMTFDKVFLDRWGVLGFAPDVAQAREWYDRAIKLGSTEASRHREQLASMPK